MANILEKIVERKKEEVSLIKRKGIMPCKKPYDNYDFLKYIIKEDSLSIIAEVKRASPSKGEFCHDFNHLKIAEDYLKGGARAISVITDSDFFMGSKSYLCDIKSVIPLPVLRKDFIIDHIQIYESKLIGADAILLIVTILDKVKLKEFIHHAKEEGMACLVEVHDEWELEIAMEVESELIGVNNRNLQDFTVDIETTFRIKREVKDLVPLVSESGINSAEDIRRLTEHGITAALIGESLVKARDNRVQVLQSFVEAGKR